MATYLITGIAGFIGSSIAHTLVQQGHKVRGIDNLSTGKLENLEDIRSAIAFEEADIRDSRAMNQICRNVDYVLHQAALASVPRSVQDPLTSHESNVNGTLSVLLAARDASVKRVVYAASSSAYGDQPTQPKHEEMTAQPLSPYAVQKLTGEYYMQSFCKVYGMEAVCLRYFNIFGPRQGADSPYSGVIAKFIHTMLDGEAPTILGDGLTSRDFTFVSNAVNANLLACSAPAKYATGRVFNVGTGHSHTLNELYAALARLIGFTNNPKYRAARTGDVQHSLASIERAQSELGYQPQADFHSGLAQTVAWYLQQRVDAEETVALTA